MSRGSQKVWPTMPQGVDELQLQRLLGRGYFGEVWFAIATRSEANPRSFAVKKVDLALILENGLSDQLQREIRILRSLDHPRIIKLHFDFSDERHMYLGMEFAPGGTLFDRLHKAGRFDAAEGCRYFFETCEALDYLHHLPEKVVHRDIKPENILLDSEDHVKLADFGWANFLAAPSAKRETFCGTLDYLSPEMILGTGHDESADMWNMGVLLYELLTGKSPFASTDKQATCRSIIGLVLRFPAGLDADAQDLITNLCTKSPANRLSVRGATDHVFVRKFIGAPASRYVPMDVAIAESGLSPTPRSRETFAEGLLEEVQELLKAKQNTEISLLRLTEDFDHQYQLTCRERQQRLEVERNLAQSVQLAKARDQEVAELRREVESLQAEVRRFSPTNRDKWWKRSRVPQVGPDAPPPFLSQCPSTGDEE